MDLINKNELELAEFVKNADNTLLAIEKFNNCKNHHLEQKEKGFTDWVLQQDFNWFGKPIPKGTLFIQINADCYWPSIAGVRIPTMQVDFYTVKVNENYFKPFSFFVEKEVA